MWFLLWPEGESGFLVQEGLRNCPQNREHLGHPLCPCAWDLT